MQLPEILCDNNESPLIHSSMNITKQWHVGTLWNKGQQNLHQNSFMKMHLKMAPVKCQLFWSGLIRVRTQETKQLSGDAVEETVQ